MSTLLFSCCCIAVVAMCYFTNSGFCFAQKRSYRMTGDKHEVVLIKNLKRLVFTDIPICFESLKCKLAVNVRCNCIICNVQISERFKTKLVIKGKCFCLCADCNAWKSVTILDMKIRITICDHWTIPRNPLVNLLPSITH